MERVDSLCEAVAQNNVQVLMGFQFRSHPGLLALKNWLGQGEIGAPVSVRAHWGEYLPNWHPWEDYRAGYAARPDLGGGVVLTLCHPFDYLRMLLGDVEAIWSVTSHRGLGLPVEDTAETGLRFANGAVGNVHLDFLQRPPKHTLEIIGTEGTMLWDNRDGAATIFRASTNAWETASPPAGFERNTLFVNELQHFLAVVRGEASPVCTLEDGVKVLEICLKILETPQA
jgi:predicted dehydrogenase